MTAVEFVLNLVIGVDLQGKDVRVKDSLTVDEIKQAKEMEREQRIDFARHCLDRAKEMEKKQHQETWETAHQAGRFEGKGIAEENWPYWDETFKSE